VGCDIHFVLERKVNGKWLGLLSEHPRDIAAASRNYAAFAELASVRGNSSKHRVPRFIPYDISDLALYRVAKDGTDGHSHSYLPLRDFCQAYLDADDLMNASGFAAVPKVAERHKDEPWESLFGIYIEDEAEDGTPEDYRVIFWFDN
jgi:hypothetical protein